MPDQWPFCSPSLTVSKVDVHWPYTGEAEAMATASRTRDQRIEFRTTAEVRELVDRAVEAAGTQLTDFAEASLVQSAQRVLADRDRFELSAEAADEWDKINSRPARELAGLRRLLDRPSPFEE